MSGDVFAVERRTQVPYHVPACDDAYTPAKCSAGDHYHDQTQSPQSDPHSNCTSCGHCFDGPCDCGKGIPCGMCKVRCGSWVPVQCIYLAPPSGGVNRIYLPALHEVE